MPHTYKQIISKYREEMFLLGFSEFNLISLVGFIKQRIMGNSCQGQKEDLCFMVDSFNSKFVNQSWKILKKHQLLRILSTQQEEQIIQSLQNVSNTNQITKIKVEGNPNLIVSIKPNKFIVVSTISQDSLCGKCEIAFQGNKIYIGELKQDRIEGKGELIFQSNFQNNPKTVTIKGEWSESVKGSVRIGQEELQFPFFASKDMISKEKNCRYIQYPNYDEYIGSTQHDLAHGQGKYIYRNGDKHNMYPIYQGFFERGKRHGYGIMKINASTELHINWKEGRPDGSGFMLINNIKHFVMYQRGKRIEKLVSDLD